MKLLTLTIFLIILITSCAQEADIDVVEPKVTIAEPEEIDTIVEPEEPTKAIEEEKLEETKKPSKEENIIEMREGSFYPKDKTIKANTEITWIKKDPREYKIACYLEGDRIAVSPNLKEGDSFTHIFLKGGEYTCITFPYGLRSTIIVEDVAPLLSPTGNVIIDAKLKISPIAAIVFAAIIVLIVIIFRRKK